MQCGAASRAARKLKSLVDAKAHSAAVARSIRVVSDLERDTAAQPRRRFTSRSPSDRPLQVIRGLWSTASIGDEVVEMFARQAVPASTRAFEDVGQLPFGPYGVPTTTIVANTADVERSDARRSSRRPRRISWRRCRTPASEALLSHLTVGAHARLAEDGRKAVAQMGNQQRASADVLIMFGQAIEREQRRMRSFERFMPAPVDPMLHSRILDMEKGITSVWTSMGITSSPFVPAAERIRGRGGEDRRIVRRVGTGPLPTPEPPTAFLKFPNVDVVIYELGNFIDGKRSISDIRDAVSAEFGPMALAGGRRLLRAAREEGAITIK